MKDKYFYSICFALIIVFGVFKVLFFPVSPPIDFENLVGEERLWYGQIIEEPDVREMNQRLTVKISKDNENKESTKIIVVTRLGTEYEYGSWVKFQGVLEKPGNFVTDTGKNFDYVSYLAKDGIFYIVSYPEISPLGGWQDDHGSTLKRTLIFVKQKFLEKINYAILGNEELLMSGLILGEKASFSRDLRQDFIDTGTIHIVALSGYNITIVAEWLMKAFSFLGFNLSIGFGVLGIFFFVLMTGASSTALRAGIMAVLALLARATGRTYDIGRALVLAGTVMVMINPMVLLYDVSFQLSFLATVGVIYLSPRTDKYFTWVTKRFGLRDVASVTFATYIFVLPFILYKMGNLSLVSLPTNFFVLPFIPLTMGLGFVTGFVGFVSPFLSLLFGYIATLFLKYELWVIHFFANLPFASFAISDFPLVLTLVIYLGFIYKIFGKNIKTLFSR